MVVESLWGYKPPPCLALQVSCRPACRWEFEHDTPSCVTTPALSHPHHAFTPFCFKRSRSACSLSSTDLGGSPGIPLPELAKLNADGLPLPEYTDDEALRPDTAVLSGCVGNSCRLGIESYPAWTGRGSGCL
jgi:hypothetical protein